MTAQQYDRLTRPFRRHPALFRLFIRCNRVLTGAVYVLYPLLVCFLLVTQDSRVVRVILVPAISFALVSAFRAWYNAPRPYEVLAIRPLIAKDTRGHSFPSRHVFSVFVIATAYWFVQPACGAALCVVGVALAVFRVIGGVHFLQDVLCGAAIGLASGWIGFVLIP